MVERIACKASTLGRMTAEYCAMHDDFEAQVGQVFLEVASLPTINETAQSSPQSVRLRPT